MSRQPIPLEQAFWSKVDKRGPDECWPWTGRRAAGGYGLIARMENGKSRDLRASRVSWEIHNGRPFPAGMFALHTCDNPPCVNPAHLWPGDRAANAADMIAKGRQNWSGLRSQGPRTCTHQFVSGRRCLECKRAYDAANREKKSEYWRTYGPTIRNERRRQRRAALRSQIQL